MPPEDAADLISECLKTMVDIILKYEGSINRFLGDSVLAFFGIPEIHEVECLAQAREDTWHRRAPNGYDR